MGRTAHTGKDLINLADRTPEERKAISRKGVEARQKKRKELKDQKELLQILLAQNVRNKEVKAMLLSMGFADDSLTNQALLITSLFNQAVSGGTNAVGAYDRLKEIMNTGANTSEYLQSLKDKINAVDFEKINFNFYNLKGLFNDDEIDLLASMYSKLQTSSTTGIIDYLKGRSLVNFADEEASENSAKQQAKYSNLLREYEDLKKDYELLQHKFNIENKLSDLEQ